MAGETLQLVIKKEKRNVFRLLFQSLQYGERLVQSFNRHLIRVKDKLANKRGKVTWGLYDSESNESKGRYKGSSAIKIFDYEV